MPVTDLDQGEAPPPLDLVHRGAGWFLSKATAADYENDLEMA